MKKLTPKQEAFAQAYVKTGSLIQAYRSAYNTKSSDDAVKANAAKVLKNTTVALRVSELQEKAKKVADKKFEITAEIKMGYLLKVVEAGLESFDESGKPFNLSAVTSAIAELNKMAGDHAPTKTENKHEVLSREEILERLL